jgi:predicted RNase H-like HicB family nuclease
MAQRFYPAVLERTTKSTFAVWFPDFPDCVAAGRSQEEAIEKAQNTLAHTVDSMAEREQPLPTPTAFDQIKLPKGGNFIAFFVIGVEPPDPTERVNIYLPKSLIARADKRAAELGMSRSSFFGLAISGALGALMPRGMVPLLPAGARSKALQMGKLREVKGRGKKSSP